MEVEQAFADPRQRWWDVPRFRWCPLDEVRIIEERPRVEIPRDVVKTRTWIVNVMFKDPLSSDFGPHNYLWRRNFDARPLWAEVMHEFFTDPNTPWSTFADIDFVHRVHRVEQMSDPVPWPTYPTWYWDQPIIYTDDLVLRRMPQLKPRPGGILSLMICAYCGFERYVKIVGNTSEGRQTTLCASCMLKTSRRTYEMDEYRVRDSQMIADLQERIAMGFESIPEHPLRPSVNG